MEEYSDMQVAEGELRRLLDMQHLGLAHTALFKAYTSRTPSEKDAFVAGLIGRVVALEGLKRVRAA